VNPGFKGGVLRECPILKCEEGSHGVEGGVVRTRGGTVETVVCKEKLRTTEGLERTIPFRFVRTLPSCRDSLRLCISVQGVRRRLVSCYIDRLRADRPLQGEDEIVEGINVRSEVLAVIDRAVEQHKHINVAVGPCLATSLGAVQNYATEALTVRLQQPLSHFGEELMTFHE
jgi:hypothetical protein